MRCGRTAPPSGAVLLPAGTCLPAGRSPYPAPLPRHQFRTSSKPHLQLHRGIFPQAKSQNIGVGACPIDGVMICSATLISDIPFFPRGTRCAADTARIVRGSAHELWTIGDEASERGPNEARIRVSEQRSRGPCPAHPPLWQTSFPSKAPASIISRTSRSPFPRTSSW